MEVVRGLFLIIFSELTSRVVYKGHQQGAVKTKQSTTHFYHAWNLKAREAYISVA